MAAGLLIVGTGLALLGFADADSGYGLVAASLAVLGIGMGMAMAPATDAIMGSLPLEKASVGSAVNDATRITGGALGVAILGSVLSSGYRGGMEDAVAGMPAPAADAAQRVAGRRPRGRRAGRRRAGQRRCWPPPRTRSCPACTPPRSSPASIAARRLARRARAGCPPARPRPRPRPSRARRRAGARPRMSDDRRAHARAAPLRGGRPRDRARGARAARRGRLPGAHDGEGARALRASARRRSTAATAPRRSSCARWSSTCTRTCRCPTTPAACRATSRRSPGPRSPTRRRRRFATLMPRLLAEVAHIPELQAIFYEALVQPRRDTLEAILRRAIERGEIRRRRRTSSSRSTCSPGR